MLKDSYKDIMHKEEILRSLLQNQQLQYQDYASIHNLDINYIKQQIKNLKNEGFLISIDEDECILKFVPKFIDEQQILEKTGCKIHLFRNIDSTNTYAMTNLDISSDSIVIAENQSSGKGQKNRKFVGALGTQLLFSYIYEVTNRESIQGLSLVIGVSILKSLKSYGMDSLQLKWPNDLYVGDAKLGGILVESKIFKNKVRLVIGVGINVSNILIDIFGTSIDRKITTIENELGSCPSRTDLFIKIINQLKQDLNEFFKFGFKKFKINFLESAKYLHEKVRMFSNTNEVTGIFSDIDDIGNLILKKDNGEFEKIFCGEMSLRKL